LHFDSSGWRICCCWSLRPAVAGARLCRSAPAVTTVVVCVGTTRSSAGGSMNSGKAARPWGLSSKSAPGTNTPAPFETTEPSRAGAETTKARAVPPVGRTAWSARRPEPHLRSAHRRLTEERRQEGGTAVVPQGALTRRDLHQPQLGLLLRKLRPGCRSVAHLLELPAKAQSGEMLGRFRAFSGGSGSGCGVHSDGHIECWGQLLFKQGHHPRMAFWPFRSPCSPSDQKFGLCGNEDY